MSTGGFEQAELSPCSIFDGLTDLEATFVIRDPAAVERLPPDPNVGPGPVRQRTANSELVHIVTGAHLNKGYEFMLHVLS